MAKARVPESVSAETLDQFATSKWPSILREWNTKATANRDWRTELAPEWEEAINNPYPLTDRGQRSPSLEEREILKGMGLVEVRKLTLGDKIGFLLFAPYTLDAELFPHRVRFTESGLDLIESAGVA